MVAAVKGLPQQTLDRIDCRKCGLRTTEGVARFRELKAKNIPAITTEGRRVFEAVIPSTEQLMATIDAARGEQP